MSKIVQIAALFDNNRRGVYALDDSGVVWVGADSLQYGFTWTALPALPEAPAPVEE
jgi:hypothetical protein